MKVLVCGGREFSSRQSLFAALDAIHAETPIICIVHGAARGADLLAEDWAKSREIAYRGHPAPWHTHGEWCRCSKQVPGGLTLTLIGHNLPAICKAAGMWRNREMLRREHGPRPDPNCETCHGSGEYFGHTARCENAHCALAAGYGDCAGQVEHCGCCDPRAPRIRLCVAFKGGVGTAAMIRLCEEAGIPVRRPS